MNETSKTLSIIAYYLSKYDLDAVTCLGYKNRSDAMKRLSIIFGRDNNYLKLRRDEFDVVTGSHRMGWRNRKPDGDVSQLTNYLNQFTFEQLSEIIIGLIDNQNTNIDLNEIKYIIASNKNGFQNEEDIERIINFEDPNATISTHEGKIIKRIYNRVIIDQLKQLCKYRCQICGDETQSTYGTDIVEAHHIEYFSVSGNNNASNIIILCPNHHRLIHRLNPQFDRGNYKWIYPNGFEEIVKFPMHL